jgi:predicted transcriptional regulator
VFTKPFAVSGVGIVFFDEVFAKIEATKNEFDSKIQTEFQKLRLLKMNPSEMDLKNLPILQEKVNDLTKKINTDNWISEQPKFNDLNKFISEVEVNDIILM